MTTITPLPTTEQLTEMNRAWTQTSINEVSTPGTIGMYGTADKYYFYMTFTANSADAWHDGNTSKDFRIIFQMGGQQSDWTGLTLSIPTATQTAAASKSYAGGQSVELEKISVTNSVQTQGGAKIKEESNNNSDFSGYLDFKSNASVIQTNVYLNRLIETTE